MSWVEVEEALPSADSIAFDGCHKIYVLLDPGQTEWMLANGYRENIAGGSWLIRSDEMDVAAMLTQLHDWFDASCSLRFINSVRSVPSDPNTGFTSLIPQGWDPDEEEE